MKRKNARRRKILLGLSVGFLALLFALFLYWRHADLNAWPCPVGATDLAVHVPADARLFTADSRAALDRALGSPSDATIAAYRAYQALGVKSLSAADRDALAERYVQALQALSETHPMPDPFDGFEIPEEGPAALSETFGRLSEGSILACFSISVEGAETAQEERARKAGDMLRLLTHGGGLVGRASALQCAMLFSREILMASIEETNAPANPEPALVALRGAEDGLGSLEDALREDRISLRFAMDDVYAQLKGPSNGEEAMAIRRGKRLGAGTAFFLRRLGADRATTERHFDDLFAALLANARAPYSPDGLVAGLPRWCRVNSRPPWTRDPVGAVVASGYLRHARFGAAVDPSIRLELRAARVAIALRAFRDRTGHYPESLGETVGEGLLEDTDIQDPFRAAPASFGYARTADGWRLWSVGLDQTDGGGAIDGFTERDPKRQKAADLVFTSNEREIRRTSFGVR